MTVTSTGVARLEIVLCSKPVLKATMVPCVLALEGPKCFYLETDCEMLSILNGQPGLIKQTEKHALRICCESAFAGHSSEAESNLATSQDEKKNAEVSVWLGL